MYASNAEWPVANQWTRRPGSTSSDAAFRASAEEQATALKQQGRRAARVVAQTNKELLFAAILKHDLAVSELLLRDSTLLERHTPSGITPLGLAAAVGDVPITSLCLSLGANVKAQDDTGASALILAAYHGHTEVVRVLLNSRQGGNAGRRVLLDQVTRKGESALMAAAKRGHLDTLEIGEVL
ncbi:MAG: hypothetical protein WDW38_002067 [Sanguina aurantia]